MKFRALLILSLLSLSALSLAEDATDEELTEESIEEEGETETVPTETTEGDKEDEKEKPGSPDADVIIHFTSDPAAISKGKEIAGGKLCEILVGFTNNGNQDFVLDWLEASLRYPMDFSYHIQNFTAARWERHVKPANEATVAYAFTPMENFAGRPLGLTINLAYHNIEGEEFVEAVFNQTVQITEVDEGFDGETFFLYLFLLAFAILLLLGGHHLFTTFGPRKEAPVKPVVETGTNIKSGIDYDWIPKDLLEDKKNTSPRQSPRPRKNAK